MAKRGQSPPPPRPANLSAEQMRSALPLLERRLAEVQALDPTGATNRRDPRFAEVELKIEDAMVSVFRETQKRASICVRSRGSSKAVRGVYSASCGD